MTNRIDAAESDIFIDGPAEFLSRKTAEKLLLDEKWTAIFGQNIDDYQRMDYSMSSLPALRIYETGYRKLFDSWFITGDLTIDLILPASLRRERLQRVPDRLCSALLQQFRRPNFYLGLREVVPGLNELGKEFSVDKALAFQIGNDLVPLTQIKANFRIDLREWDKYLEDTYRTKDYPFDRVLGDLKTIVNNIRAVDDDLDVENPEVETNIVISTEE